MGAHSKSVTGTHGGAFPLRGSRAPSAGPSGALHQAAPLCGPGPRVLLPVTAFFRCGAILSPFLPAVKGWSGKKARFWALFGRRRGGLWPSARPSPHRGEGGPEGRMRGVGSKNSLWGPRAHPHPSGLRPSTFPLEGGRFLGVPAPVRGRRFGLWGAASQTRHALCPSVGRDALLCGARRLGAPSPLCRGGLGPPAACGCRSQEGVLMPRSSRE